MCHIRCVVRCLVSCRYKWDKNPPHLKPETGLLALRAGLNAFANLRPAVVLPQVSRPRPVTCLGRAGSERRAE